MNGQGQGNANIGPELVSQLTGRAWTVTQEIDHQRLIQSDGTRYLIEFLEERLGRVPVPDAGTKAEELFVRLRRPVGMSMASWCHKVRETYRGLQRALKRARRDQEPSRSPTARTPSSVSSRRSHPTSSPTSTRRRASRQTIPEPEQDESPGASGMEDQPDRDEAGDETRAAAAEAETSPRPKGGKGKGGSRGDRTLHSPSESYDKGSETDTEDLLQGIKLWDEFDTGLPEVLPSELLGWLMLRRCSLSSQQRLNILSSVGNSLRAEDIERGLRGAEDELRLHERDHQKGGGKGQKGRAVFWMEHGGEWALLNAAEEDMEDWTTDVHWVGTSQDLAANYGIYASTSSLPSSSQSRHGEQGVWYQEDDGAHTWWDWDSESGEYYHQDALGSFWAWSEWESAQNMAMFSEDQQKELAEAYATYETKLRSFAESRNLMQNKQMNRGFYPAKGKSKGKFKSRPRPSTAYNPPSQKGGKPGSAMTADVMMNSPGPGYTGCFICGGDDHGFRQCPRKQSSKKGGKGSGNIYVVTEVVNRERPEEVPSILPDFVGHVAQPDLEGFAVLDTGATETITSLEALEYVISKRRIRFGQEDVQVVDGPQKVFRFGNGQVQSSESFVLIPQTLGKHKIALGAFTIDAPGVPLLLGIRSLDKLGAIIDCSRSMMVLKTVDAALMDPTQKVFYRPFVD